MANADFTLKANSYKTTGNLIKNIENHDGKFSLRLGNKLFSDPMRERNNAIVVANTSDATANIQPGDLLQVDFTATELIEGLYIITLDDGWIGYRFFQRMPTLYMKDNEGNSPVTLAMLKRGLK